MPQNPIKLKEYSILYNNKNLFFMVNLFTIHCIIHNEKNIVHFIFFYIFY